MKLIHKNGKTIVELEVPLQLKKEVGGLLNELMKSYNVKGNSPEMTKAFKDIFKSNLYVLLDNEYHNQK